MHRHFLIVVLGFQSFAAAAAQDPSSERGDPTLGGCVVKFVDDIELPAPEAGVLLFLGVKDGALVKQNEEIARIDDREPQVQREIAVHKFNASKARYLDEVDLKYARKASEVADAEYQEKLEANRSGVGAVVTESEVRKAKLDAERSVLAIEKAMKDKELAKFDALVAQSEIKASDIMIEKRIVRAPFDGEVRKVTRQESEWVNLGDTILQLVRYDVLQVEGMIDLKTYDPAEIAGREATVTVEVGRGRSEQVAGRVVLVEQQVRQSNRAEYMVRVEVPNRQVDGRWVILPGLSATMQIHLDRPAVNVSRARTER